MSVTRKTIHLYMQHVRRHRIAFVALCLLTAAAIILGQVMTPYIASLILDKLSSSPDSLSPFLPLLGFYAGVLIAELILWRVMVWFLWQFEVDIIQELVERTFRYLTNQSNRFHTNRFGGALVSQTNKFVGAFERVADGFFFEILTTVVYFIAIMVILGGRVPLYALTLATGCTLFLTVMLWRSRKQQPFNVAEAQSESSRTAQLADSITNITTVKAFAQETTEQKLFHRRALDTSRKSLRVRRIQTINDIFFNGITSSIGWLALAIGTFAVVRLGAPLGTVLLVVSYTGNMSRRLWDMSRVTRNLNRAFGDAHDMTEILQLDLEIQDIKGARELHATRGDIVFDTVTFAYPEQPDTHLFKELNLHIKPGEKVGLVGHSGSGKTTITKLLLRLMDLSGGSIQLDGQDISKVTQSSLREAIAYVPQEPLMFHRSLADNIRYGKLEASTKEVQAAARMANAHDFIMGLHKQYETLVGERGTKLSGGQRQRVAIARAMIKNAPILVLDEATSALDSESEQLIQDALWKLMEGRTAIVIAHRLSTIQKMDRIIVMDEGKIVEQGSHRELLRQNGAYAKLWEHQSGGFIEE